MDGRQAHTGQDGTSGALVPIGCALVVALVVGMIVALVVLSFVYVIVRASIG